MMICEFAEVDIPSVGGSNLTRRRIVDDQAGYSMVELILSLAITLVIMGVAVVAFTAALGSRNRESSNTDAIASTQAALNIITREVGNAGYGLDYNGIVIADSTDKRLHIRSNLNNSDSSTNSPGEDVTLYYDDDPTSKSVVRYDANAAGVKTSGVINRVSDVSFIYHNYLPNGSSSPGAASPLTGRITIVLKVFLTDVQGQPSGRIITVQSDVTLRNSNYHLGQY